MQINKLKYNQFIDSERHWVLNEVELERINLLVGKNASGKSKTLSVINALSSILSENNKLPYEDGFYDIEFASNDEAFNYVLEYHNHKIVLERLSHQGVLKIERGENSKGIIMSKHDSPHAFEIPENELKANRRDKENYPYLENINNWANHVRIFNFGAMHKGQFAIKDPSIKELEFNLKNTDAGVIMTFSQGLKKFPETYLKSIINDFNSIGYDIEDVSLGAQISASLQIVGNPSIEVLGLRVKEKGLDCMTDQWDMSTGMFRALAIIIHFNYYELANISGTVLIDDVGEGLDYERSSKLIDLLITKAESNPSMQLLMTTNDSFVMNAINLKYWQIIDRVGSDINYYNIKNSKEIFEEYKFTGLNNFDFFTTGFFKKGFEK